jgi:hypothetical protein
VVATNVALSIEQHRLAALAADLHGNKSAPYDHPALARLAVDAEGLVPLAAFELDGDALCINGHAFFVAPPVPGSNAPYWLLQEFRRRKLVQSVRVRLDPLLFGRQDDLRGRFYRSLVFGQPLDWKRVRGLRAPEFGSWAPGKMSRKYHVTDYAWIPHDSEVDFLCEELPLAGEICERGARYLHAIYDKRSDRLSHLDGAIRIYTTDEIDRRSATHVRKAGKIGRRVKVFRTDAAVDRDSLSAIAEAFFVWNWDVARYFGAPVPIDF